jgi:maltooligosyltrehalose synthase
MKPSIESVEKAKKVMELMVSVPHFRNSNEDNRLVSQTQLIAEAIEEARQRGRSEMREVLERIKKLLEMPLSFVKEEPFGEMNCSRALNIINAELKGQS